jgi:glycosyltransferase involved in cell wall biosynthesis
VRILWHSFAPWCTTGFGQQTALWVPQLAALGHDVAISACYGLQQATTEWRGHRVYPAGYRLHSVDMVGFYARDWAADWVITLTETRNLRGADLDGVNVASWVPVHASPISAEDRGELKGATRLPIAMSRFGERALRRARLSPLYVPHGIDCSLWQPPADRDALRAELGVADRFVILIVAANYGAEHKNWDGQLEAFAAFQVRHPDALLLAHTTWRSQIGPDLRHLAEASGVPPDAIRFADLDRMKAGLVTPHELAGLYGAADLVSNCTLVEGFGLAPVEAMACGTPVVVTDGSAMSEVGGPGAWKVSGEPVGRDYPGWHRPSVTAILDAYEDAYQRGPSYQAKAAAARKHALTYDLPRVLDRHWAPALAELEDRLEDRLEDCAAASAEA